MDGRALRLSPDGVVGDVDRLPHRFSDVRRVPIGFGVPPLPELAENAVGCDGAGQLTRCRAADPVGDNQDRRPSLDFEGSRRCLRGLLAGLKISV
jgi:hypothetical protein